MTTILPADRTSADAIFSQIGRGLSETLPQAAAQRSQRETGLNAIDDLQRQLKDANGDINKILPAYARAMTLNPNLERSGLLEHAMKSARLNNVFGGQGGQGGQPQGVNPQTGVNPQGNVGSGQPEGLPQNNQSTSPLDTAPNLSGIIPTLDTDQDIDQKARQWAISLNDPNEYARAKERFYNERTQAQNQISKLEDLASEQGVSRQDMPEFMTIGKNHNYMKDPNKWVMATNKDWGPYKNAKEQLQNAFIPGFFKSLINSNETRDKALRRLENPIQEILKLNPALEPKIRADLQSEYLSPTEVELAIHPLGEQTQSNLKNMPKGIFPNEGTNISYEKGHPEVKKKPFVSYDEAVKKAPREMEIMNKRLVNFLKQNVKEDTTLLGLRHELWEKDYDWRQIGDAMQEAATGENAIKLSPNQKAELAQLQTQAPKQSISDIFRDWGNWQDYLRGQK